MRINGGLLFFSGLLFCGCLKLTLPRGQYAFIYGRARARDHLKVQLVVNDLNQHEAQVFIE